MKVEQLLETVVKPWRVDKLDAQQGIALLNKHCKDGLKAISEDKLLFRGFLKQPGGPIVVIDTTKAERTSRDSSNLYHLLMDASDYFHGWPSRSNSLICTDEHGSIAEFARYEANEYVIFPFDGTEICTSGVSDFLNSGDFTDGIFKTLACMDVDSLVSDWLHALGIRRTEYKLADLPTINETLKRTHPMKVLVTLVEEGGLNEHEIWGNSPRIYDLLHDSDDDPELYDKLDKLSKLMPKSTREIYGQFKFNPHPFDGFATATTRPQWLSLHKGKFGELKPNGETWFSGKAVAIRARTFVKILAVLEQQGLRLPPSLDELIETYKSEYKKGKW